MNKARRSRIRNSLPLCGLDIYKYKEAAGGGPVSLMLAKDLEKASWFSAVTSEHHLVDV